MEFFMEIKAREQWRIERIKKAIKITASILGMDEAQLMALIHDIDDIQGVLHVFWRHPMTSVQSRAFSTAWDLCGEKHENTKHYVFW